jgi:hypothetical protein
MAMLAVLLPIGLLFLILALGRFEEAMLAPYTPRTPRNAQVPEQATTSVAAE